MLFLFFVFLCMFLFLLCIMFMLFVMLLCHLLVNEDMTELRGPQKVLERSTNIQGLFYAVSYKHGQQHISCLHATLLADKLLKALHGRAKLRYHRNLLGSQLALRTALRGRHEVKQERLRPCFGDGWLPGSERVKGDAFLLAVGAGSCCFL